MAMAVAVVVAMAMAMAMAAAVAGGYGAWPKTCLALEMTKLSMQYRLSAASSVEV